MTEDANDGRADRDEEKGYAKRRPTERCLDNRPVVKADVRLVQGEGDYRLGLDVVSLTNGGGYLFGINPRNGAYSLFRVDDGNWKGGVALIDWTPSPHIRRDLETNRLRMERNQATITLYINDQQVASLQDSTYQHSGIGWTLYVRNYAQPSITQFSNIRQLAWP